jgi:hypothetical protein
MKINMTTTTNEHGQQNMFAKEPQMYIPEEIIEAMNNEVYETHNEKAERLNGRLAMLGFVIAVGTYITTGQIIPGVF